MPVYQKEDGRYYVQYRTGGKIKKEYFGRGIEAKNAATRRDEELSYRRKIDKLKPIESITFSQLATAYLEAKETDMSISSIKSVVYRLKKSIIPHMGHILAIDINHSRLQDYVNKRSKTVKNTTIHREISDIRAMLNWGVRRHIIHKSYAEGFDMPRRDDDIIRPPSIEELQAILKHSAAHLRRAIIVCYYTGLRPGVSELSSLGWDSVDWIGRVIWIRSAKKGGLRVRPIAIHPTFYEALCVWHDADKRGKVGNGPIVHYKGRPIISLKRSFENAKRRAGISRRLRLYDMRHAWASFLLGKGADLKTTSLMLGHTSTSTTTNIYQHVINDEAQRDIVVRLPDLDFSI